MFKCSNLKLRTKNYNKYLWCNDKKKVIILSECENCSKRILKRNKPIKKVSKKINVSKETYNKVIERDKYSCRLYDKECQGNLELHHIYYRSERKDLIDEPNNCIMLCLYHHNKVHKNKHYWQPILLEKVKEKR